MLKKNGIDRKKQKQYKKLRKLKIVIKIEKKTNKNI